MNPAPTVFFVDDSATMREVLRSALRREALNVVVCPDSRQALSLIEQTAPDVVISDILMPGKDGFELCRDIRRHPRLAHTPVILVSSVVDKAVAEKAFAAQADELVRKPFHPQDLIARVRRLLDNRATAPLPPAPEELAAVLAALPQSAAPAAAPVPAFSPQAAALLAAATSHVPAAALAPPPAAPAPATAAAPAAVPQQVLPQAAELLETPEQLRLELALCRALIRKLEAEAAAEREYARALQAQLRALQGLPEE
jgi:CheY-like chemotaxis protein